MRWRRAGRCLLCAVRCLMTIAGMHYHGIVLMLLSIHRSPVTCSTLLHVIAAHDWDSSGENRSAHA